MRTAPSSPRISTGTEAEYRIPLGGGLFARVDAVDFAFLMQWSWSHVRNKNGTPYARRNRKIMGRSSGISMHRFLLAAPQGVEVDHINGDTLDNRKANLRFCTRSQNVANTPNRKPKNGSGYIGVFKSKGGSWRFRIRENGCERAYGYFDDPEAAARAYDQKAIEIRGEFATLNFREGNAQCANPR